MNIQTVSGERMNKSAVVQTDNAKEKIINKIKQAD